MNKTRNEMDGVSAVIRGRAPPLLEDRPLTPMSEASPAQILLTLRDEQEKQNIFSWKLWCLGHLLCTMLVCCFYFGGFTLAAWWHVRFHKKHRGELEGLYEDNKRAAEQRTTLLDGECEERCRSLPKPLPAGASCACVSPHWKQHTPFRRRERPTSPVFSVCARCLLCFAIFWGKVLHRIMLFTWSLQLDF